ncbi:hypothetical protein JHK87_044918 [Glycine soja]|nr:hypothetical protein JHK87_044918 [Glycine soja]
MHSEAEALEHTKKRDTGHQSVSLENKTGDSTVLKIGDSAKVVIKQNMKGRKHKYGFNNNKREKTEKKRVVDDETGDKHELNQSRQQRNLMYLAAITDSQPQPSPLASQVHHTLGDITATAFLSASIAARHAQPTWHELQWKSRPPHAAK